MNGTVVDGLSEGGRDVDFPMLMVLAQPDLGTALTYLPVAIMGLFLGGLRWKQALIVVMIAGLLVPVAWMKVLKSYQKERLTSFINPDADRQGSGYRVESIVDCGGVGRDLGEQSGIPDASGVSSGAATARSSSASDMRRGRRSGPRGTPRPHPRPESGAIRGRPGRPAAGRWVSAVAASRATRKVRPTRPAIAAASWSARS